MIETPNIRDKTLRGIMDLQIYTGLIYPCGSRFFGDAKKSSDFDFFVKHDESTVIHFKNIGWEDSEQHSYRDVNSVDILNKGEATLITVRSVENRRKVQDYLFKFGIKRKKGDVDFWDDLYDKLARGEIQ